jgi:predicted regulator of Ras-like GTPase activity (Roadblock/LC7/MglB family)
MQITQGESTIMTSADITWLLDDLSARIPEIDQVVALSRDGLAIASSASLRAEDAERLAAIAAGFQSLGRAAAEYIGAEGVRQVMLEMAGKYLFITAAGPDGCLAVITAASADIGLVAYEMALLAGRMGPLLPGPRRALRTGGRDT